MQSNIKTTMKINHQTSAVLSLLLLISFLLLFSGCQPNPSDTAIESSDQPANTSNAGSSVDTTQTTSQTTTLSTETTQTEATNSDGQFSETDLLIYLNGQTFQMLDDASGLIELLGDDYQYSEADSCVFEGMDKTFDYGSIVVYTVPKGTIDLLDGFDILDNSVATAKGITVGSSADDVLSAYGQPAGDAYDWVYNVSGDIDRVGDPRLTIYFDDSDQVSYISYYSGSNAEN